MRKVSTGQSNLNSFSRQIQCRSSSRCSCGRGSVRYRGNIEHSPQSIEDAALRDGSHACIRIRSKHDSFYTSPCMCSSCSCSRALIRGIHRVFSALRSAQERRMCCQPACSHTRYESHTACGCVWVRVGACACGCVWVRACVRMRVRVYTHLQPRAVRKLRRDESHPQFRQAHVPTALRTPLRTPLRRRVRGCCV